MNNLIQSYGVLSYRWVFVVFAILSTSCTTNIEQDDNNISSLDFYEVKKSYYEYDPVVTREVVFRKYEEFLQVSDPDTFVSIEARKRMASLRIDEEEAKLVSLEEDVEIDESEILASLEDYKKVISENPYAPGKDDIYYQMAKAYDLIGDLENQERYLLELVENYPDSTLYADSAFRLGDLLYAQGRYIEAEESFSRVVNKGSENNKFYLNSAYMKAWSQFKQSRYDDALLSFAYVLDNGFATEEEASKATGLYGEILKDSVFTMGVIFSYQGEWNDIGLFFDEYGDRYYEYMIYSGLADFYYEQKFYESAASTLVSYVQRFPNSKYGPGFYTNAIERFGSAGYPLRKREYQQQFIERFGIDSEFWELHPEMHDEVKEYLAKYSLDLAKFNHGMAQQTLDPKERSERYESAVKWYDIYTRTYPDAENAAEANFLLAEISYELKDYPRAKRHYRTVAFDFPDSEFADQAAYALILTYQKYEPADEEEAKAWRQESAHDSLRFVEAYPNHPERGKILVSTSEKFFKDENYKEAYDVANRALESKDTLGEKYAYGAALVMANSAYELGYYQEAENGFASALSFSGLDKKTKKDLTEKMLASIYKQGELAKNNGDFKAAASNWRRLSEIAPGSANAINAEFDAATILLESKDFDSAINAFKEFKRKYPNHASTKSIQGKLIYANEEKGDWNEAASLLSQICFNKNEKDKEKKRISCFQSAEDYEKADNDDRATYLYKFYAHSYKEPLELAVEAHSKLNSLYKKMGESEKRVFWLEKVIELNKNAKEPTERSTYLAADALYELGEMAREKYESIELTLPLNDSIPVKNEAMQKAQNLYTESVEQGVLDYTTSSTYRIAQLYSQLGRALIDSEVPEELDELEAEEYVFLLEDQAYPIEQTAIQIHQTNINRTYDGVYDEWVKKSFDELGRLLPTQYRKKERVDTYANEIR